MSTMTERPSGLAVPRAAAGVIPFHGENVNIGPGVLWVAAVGAPEPAGVHGGPDALEPAVTPGTDFDETEWTPLGYTSEGSTFSYAIDTAAIEVAESLLPIRTMTTSVTITMAFALAEITAYNIQVALNGGSTVPIPGTGLDFVEFVPPRAGQEVRVAFGLGPRQRPRAHDPPPVHPNRVGGHRPPESPRLRHPPGHLHGRNPARRSRPPRLVAAHQHPRRTGDGGAPFRGAEPDGGDA